VVSPAGAPPSAARAPHANRQRERNRSGEREAGVLAQETRSEDQVGRQHGGPRHNLPEDDQQCPSRFFTQFDDDIEGV
jgi:hypothetical protein